MIFPTHVTFGVLWAAIAGAGYGRAAACAVGALLPDIDHPQSAIGRLFFFISQPLHLICGHRGIIHSFLLWSVFLLIGILTGQEIVQWLALGAISHVLIDCYSASGVRAFTPITDKSVVIFKKDWRIKTGSVQDFALCILFAAGIVAMNYTYALGGPRKLINLLVRSPRITAQEFLRAGNQRCWVKGRWRWNTGRLEEVEWLVVGTEGQTLVYFNGEKLIRENKHGEFLKSTLIQSEEEWISIKVQGIVSVNTDSLFFDGQTWYFAQAGEKALGEVRCVDNSTPDISPITQPQSP